MSPSDRSPSLSTLFRVGVGVVIVHLGLLFAGADLEAFEGAANRPPAAEAPTKERSAQTAGPQSVQPVTITQVLWTGPAVEPVRRAPVLSGPVEPAVLQPVAAPVAAVDSAASRATAQTARPQPTQPLDEQVAQASPTAVRVLAAAGLKASSLPASSPPPSTRLNYDVTGQAKGIEYRASGVLDWRLDSGSAYEARMELSMLLLGSRVQTSRGSVGPEGLRPERFGDRRRNTERAAHFEPAEGRIRFSNNAPTAALIPGAQDRLSLFLQLGGLMRSQPRSAGDAIEFQVAGVGDAEIWRFDVGATETLSLPAGAVQAVHLRRAARKPHDTTVDVWLAPDMGYLPVRLRVAQPNGDVADQQLARRP